ncbi:MAG: WD40/YVTN/BNR-like repeat-containing protein [Propylenella sp.]
MADEDDPLFSDDADARGLAEERSAISEGFFQGLYLDAATFAANPANADAHSANLPWVALGPRNVGGRIRCIAQDPINTAALYAGSAFGGLWKTTDRGDIWTPISFFLPAHPGREVSPPIGAIGICHRTPNTIYVGTGEPVPYKPPGIGLYRSTNGGGIFDQVDAAGSGTIGANRYERILVDPWDHDRAWVACQAGLWRSSAGAPIAFAQDMIATAAAVPAAAQDVTDVAINFGDRGGAAPPPTFTVYAAIRNDGIYRAAFDPATNGYRDLNAANHPFQAAGAAPGVKWAKLSGDFPDPISDAGKVSWGGLGRIKLAICERLPANVYAIFCLEDKKASRVFVSTSSGNSWKKTDSRSGDDGEQANYDLVLEVHPDRPEIFVVGIVDLFLTVNGGEDWTKIIDWLKYNAGDRAQHADQHGFLFDRADPRAIWATNDGGISYSANLGHSWRKRSHGILAVQFYDMTSHPTYPHIYGGGFQDNGTWVSYGGPTWYYLSGGDGGAMAFQHGEVHRFLTTWQGNEDTKRSLMRIAVTSRPEAANLPEIVSSLPDIPGTGENGGPPFLKYVAVDTDITDDFAGKHYGIFGGKLQGHPTRANHWIMARVGGAYVSKAGATIESTDGPEFQKLGLSDDDVEVDEDQKVQTSAIAYARSNADNEWWIGTSHGGLFRTDDSGQHWSANLAPMGRLRATFTNQSANPAGGITASGSVAVVADDLIVVNYATRGAIAGLGITDNLGNAYTALPVAGSGAGRVQPFFARVTVPGTLTDVIAAHANSTNHAALVAAIFAGPFDAAPLAKNPSPDTDSDSPYECPKTGDLPKDKNKLVVGFVAQGDGAAAYNASVPFSLAGSATSGAGANTVSGAINYRVVTGSESQTPVFTTATNTSGSTGTAAFTLPRQWIADVSVHPQNPAIVAVAVANRNRQVYVSGNRGATWRDVTGGNPLLGGTGMFRAPATSVVIDPRGPIGTGAADLQTLYLGSLAGTFVSRNITPEPGGPPPAWRTLNNQLPLTLIRDIEYGRYENPPGTLARHFLRVATYGRGAYHLELDTGALAAGPATPTTPNVRLLIRSTPINDGHRYAGAARLANDPRLRHPETGAQTALTPKIAYDIRIDAPPFTFFDRTLDGVEFDEDVRSNKLVIGETNLVYVQVHNTGFETTPAAGVGPPASNVIVRLYFADAPGGNAPDLDAGFWGAFPAAPAAGATWQRAGEVTVHALGPAQPRIARFEWQPPITLGNRVALLALASQSLHDDLSTTNTGNLHVDPGVHADAALVIEERRAALRIVEAEVFVPDLYVRDAIDDSGERGAVAWGARASDIVVVAASEADPATAFASIADAREADVIRGQAAGAAADAENFIYVRVWNRKSVPLSTTVRLYYAFFDKLSSPADWVEVKDAGGNAEVPVNDIPPHGHKFSAEFQLKNPDDPAPGQDYKAAALIAVVSAAQDTTPAINTITDLKTFWDFFLGAASANNAAFRGLRYVVEP